MKAHLNQIKYNCLFITLMVSSVTLKKELFDALALNLYPM
jgi:hypothetical protein